MTNAWEETDLSHMRMAIQEAAKAAELDEIPVGAVLVSEGVVRCYGHNRSIVDCDPSAHAEIVALRAAGALARNYRLAGATLYVTLEPCAMCVGAMLQARISRLVFGCYDSKAGAAGSVIDLCQSRELNHRIEVNGGLFADECAELLRQFFDLRR